jgi:3-oxoacyl-[acyl-carrier-protein] synthase II
MKRVVITGIGALTPIGNNANEYWTNLIAGSNGAGLITKFDTTHFKTKFACELKNFNGADVFERKEIRKYDEYSQYALVAAEEALKDSGINIENLDLYKSGVIWGSGYGGVFSTQEQVTDLERNNHIPRFSPFFIPKIIVNMAAGHIAIKFGFKGINYAPVAACATSNVAIFEGFNHIRSGNADVIICGGSEAAITEVGIGGFNAAMALSVNNDNYQTASRPFDINRDGFVMGEGAGALILEDLEHAINRGAKIYAEVVGWGNTSDAYHITASHPEGLGAQMAIKQALNMAGIKPEEVDYINAHATSTPLGDPCEIKAICAVFGEHAKKLNISATKSMTGHLLGAAGAIEGIASIKAIQTGIIPPTINTINIDPQIPSDLNLTMGKPQKRSVKIALNSTFGFGGHNVITAFKKYE